MSEYGEQGTRDTTEVSRPQPSGAWVLELGGPSGGDARVLCRGEKLVIGSGRNADLVIADPTVSQRHCRLSVQHDQVLLEDLNSTNGVYVGAVCVGSASVVDLGAFVIGRTLLMLHAGVDAAVPVVDPVPGLIGSSLSMRRVALEVRRHAKTRAPILLQGESGTGKDVVARALHQLSHRQGAYVPLNVGALPESLADAELFGHRRGAFTGALQSRPGAFEQAHAGTLFLDEIADLPLGMQVKLLRVVEDGIVRALGAAQTLQVDVRIVSASWARLEERVERQAFRADLYHRLSTVVIGLPPLRQRRSDIAELCVTLLRRIRDEVGAKALTSGALALLASYDWPGNVRELASVLYRAAMTAPTSEIAASHVLLPRSAEQSPRLSSLGAHDADSLLRENAGNISRAARAAGVPRSTFRSWLAKTQPSVPPRGNGKLAG